MNKARPPGDSDLCDTYPDCEACPRFPCDSIKHLYPRYYPRVSGCPHRSNKGKCFFPQEPSYINSNNRPDCPYHSSGHIKNCKILQIHGKKTKIHALSEATN